MGKMLARFFLAILLLFSFTFASELGFEIDKANRALPYATKGQTVSILHKLENLYISAVVKADKKLIIKSLKGIIRARKLLHMDSRTYQKEYEQLTKNSPKIEKLDRVKVTKKSISKPTSIIKPKVSSVREIRFIKMQDNTLVIKFDKPLRGSELIFYDSDTKDIKKRVYDIRANLNFKTPHLNSPLNEIKIAQNRDNLVRIVLENRSKIYSKAFIRGGNLFIKINNTPKLATKDRSKTIKIEHKKVSLEDIDKQVGSTTKRNKKSNIVIKSQTSDKPLYADTKTIVIDPGHGGKDSGAVGYKKHLEKKAVLKVAKLLKRMLVDKGYRVYMTRDGDNFIDLKSRTHMATKYNADLFISIHANAAPKGKRLSLKGIETFFLSTARTQRAKRVAAKENAAASSLDKKSKDAVLDFLNKTKIIQSNKLAIDIQSSMLEATRKKFRSVVDGGVREAPFWVLVGAQMPAVLIELGYITNPMEGDRLYNPFYQKTLAKGIFNGINNYFAKNR